MSGDVKPQPYMAAEEASNAERVRKLFGRQFAGPPRTCKGCCASETTNCDRDCAYAAEHEWKYL